MKRSKLLKTLCVVVMLAAVIFLVPSKAKAEEQGEYVGENFYSTEYDIAEYWSDGKAPLKENFVFGGWYKKVGDVYRALTESEAAETEVAYAKFVPAYVLSVKTQNEAGVTAETPQTDARLITSVDSKSYKAIGFDVYLANRIQLFKNNESDPLETTRVYDGILVNDEPVDAEDIFGTASKYVGVWTLTDILKDNYSKIIYVRPYWITPDGTKVEGLAKYVHIEDDYKNYLSIPINMLDKEAAAQVAAGAVNVTCSGDVTLVDVEEGRVLPQMEMSSRQDGNIIRIVGNTKDIGVYNDNNETIFANVRIQKPNTDVDFTINVMKCANWDETEITLIGKWDVQYDVK